MNDQLKGQTTWPEKFAQAGYTTFLTGKWHNGAESALRSFQRGKAIFLGGMGAPYHLPLQDIGAPRVFENQRASREHSVRAPLVLAGSGIPPGRQSAALCYLADIFPTIGALAGVPAPEGSEGRSLAPGLAGNVGTPREAILTAFAKVQRAVREDRWKLIGYPQINRTQLFDLRADPLEMRDLAADPQQAAEVQRMTALLRREQELAGDTQPLNSATPQPAEFDFSRARRKGRARAGE